MRQAVRAIAAAFAVALMAALPAAAQSTYSINRNLMIQSGPFSSALANGNQYGLSVVTNTQLTVPAGATCAYITVETASVRRTSDGTSATTSVGTLLLAGAQWADCGPLAAYKFTAVSGSPTLDVEYFR